MMDIAALEIEFERDLRNILVEERKYGMCSTRLAMMIEKHGGTKAAHLLLEHRDLPPNTFSYLRQIGKPELAMEHYVLMERYFPLFSDQEREIAEFRLTKQ